MIKNKFTILPAVVMTIAGLTLATSAFAEAASASQVTPETVRGFAQGYKMGMMRQGVVGTVSAVSGNTITVTSKQWQRPTSTTGTTATPTQTTVTYTVDAANATVTKSGAAGTVASIIVGDTISVQGTVSGTNVTATAIRDGVTPRPAVTGTGQKTAPVVLNPGNGLPVVAGAVTAVSGEAVTITNKSNVTYTVDATNAKIQKGSVAGALTDLATGDNLVVQGTVTGNAVVASTILDQGPTPAGSTSGTTLAPHTGFFGKIGSFFSKLFGF